MSRIRWPLAVAVSLLILACAQSPQSSDSQPPELRADLASAPQDTAVAAEYAASDAEVRHRERQRSATLAQIKASPGFVGLPAPLPQDRERYAHFDDSGVQQVATAPVSTFSIDVDTGAYANVRRWLRDGRLPPEDAVRVEELINYFTYDDAPPQGRETPFAVHLELAPTPWNPQTRLLRVALQGWQPQGALPPANLVFLVDVSGSMRSQNKLPLVKSSLQLLARSLGAQDRISLVTYAGATRVVLEPTPGDQTAKIIAAIDSLDAGGGTNGAAGIELAYAMAQQGMIDGGINRVLLATDGDFNVGTVNFEQLKDLVERRRGTGVSVSTLGFGSGNYNDQLMEQLADAGNGNYAYIDSLSEARRALVTARAGTLQTIAQDVKIQLEFNPSRVAEYRLIGYENRALNREDFNNDKVDAGEIGAGHHVTALYEIALVGDGGARIDPLRYGAAPAADTHGGELGFLRLRYKQPGADRSRLIETPITAQVLRAGLAQSSDDFRFAAAVAGFGQLLRGGRYTEDYGYDAVLALARGSRGADPDGWRGEFLQLVQLAQALSGVATSTGSPDGCDFEACG